MLKKKEKYLMKKDLLLMNLRQEQMAIATQPF